MLMSAKRLDLEKQNALKIGRESFIAHLIAWHKKVEERQRELESHYTAQAIENYSINIWDEYTDLGETFAYVEMTEVPNSICFELLNRMLLFARGNKAVNKLDIGLAMRFYDSSTFHPALIGNKEAEFTMYKRWEIVISHVTPTKLENLVRELNACPPYLRIPFDVYSES